jgi:hypothetical protein
MTRTPAVLLFLAALAAADASAETIRLKLQDLTALKKLELRCVSDERQIDVPVPERWSVSRMELHLRYTVSTNLIPESSQLVVKVGGQPVAQARLNPMAPEVKLGIEIPVGLLQPGYNALVFQVAQHFSKNQCESPCSPDLWTNISLADSYVEMKYEWKDVPRELSSLSSFVFDPRLMPAGEVHIVTEDDSARSATLAGIVASGIARRFDYRPVSFSVSRTPRPGMDNVLVGKRPFAAKVAPAGTAIGAGRGGRLRVGPMVGPKGEPDPKRALLIVTGDTDEAVKLAAITFTNISFRFPGSEELETTGFTVPDVQQYSGRETIATGQVYEFSTLNFPTHSFVGVNPGARGFTFRLPPDFHIRPNQYAKLVLNFSYGAGLKGDSSFAVTVNGRGVRAVALDSPAGNFIDGYKLEIPTYVFRPGSNTIEMAANLHAPGQVCDLIQPDGMFLTLYGNSTISFPAMPHFVEMPKLDLFMHSGFPVTRWPDGHEAAIWLTEKDDRVLAAALNVLGVATQRNGFPLFEVEFTHERPKAEGEVLVVGRLGSVDAELLRVAPLRIVDGEIQVPYPVVRGWNTEHSAPATSRQKGALGTRRGVMMQFQSPWYSGRTVTMLAAERAEDLQAASMLLTTSAVQGQVRGDLVLVESAEPDAVVSAMDTGARYATGKKGSYSPIESFLYTRPVAYYGAAGLGLVLLCVGLFFGLRRLRAIRRK